MPIRRLFGLLVCVLSLSSAPVLAQTVSFIDEAGAPAADYLEFARAYVRVEDAAANTVPGFAEAVSVTLATVLAGDSETLSLTETGPDTGIFEGSMNIGRSPALPDGHLQTAIQAGPPVVRETLTVQYAPGITDTAVLVGARIQLLDDYGRPATGYTEGDWITVRVVDYLQPYNDPDLRDGVTVAVNVLAVSDEEFIVLQETGNSTYIYEGRIQAVLHATYDDDGIVGAPAGNLVHAQHAVSDAQEHVDAVVPLVGSRAEILNAANAAGDPADYMAESSTIRLRAVDRTVGGPGLVDTVQAEVSSEIGLDEETVTLTETGATTGVFESDLETSIDATSPGNGQLETAEDPGPPHRFDTVTLAYQGSSDTIATYGSETFFIDSFGNDTQAYSDGSRVYVRVIDYNYDQSAAPDSASATVLSHNTGDAEIINLTETGNHTAVFEGSLPIELQTSGAVLGDGQLQAPATQVIEARHTDALGNTASGDLAVMRYSQVEFFDEQGRPTRELLEGGLAFIRLYHAGENYSISTPDTTPVTVRSLFTGDDEIVQLTETGPDTGIFEGSIRLAYVSLYSPVTSNGILETSSGGENPQQDTVTVEATDSEATATTIGARIRLIDRFGNDATSFAVGEMVGVRVEDYNVNDPQLRQTLQAVIVVNSQAHEVESVNVLETGYGTGVFEGLIASRLATSATVNDGTLDLQAGDLLQARHVWLHAPPIATDDAVVTGSSVRFVDAEGQPAESYLEASTAFVRLVYAAGDSSSSVNAVDVTVSAAISQDVESLALTETGAATGIFTGSLALRSDTASPGDGFLQTQRRTSPAELDTLTVSHGSGSDTATMSGSRIWFLDASGNVTDSYAEGSRAYIRVEDHNVGVPYYDDMVQVMLSSLGMGDYEMVTLAETAQDSGIFEGSMPMEAGPGTYTQPNDGELEAQAVEQIEAFYNESAGGGPKVRAQITGGSIDFVDEAGAVTFEMAEGGLARLRVFSVTSTPSDILVRSRYGDDAEPVALTETMPGSRIYEGTVQLQSVSAGGGVAYNGLLETSNGGSPEYLPDELTAEYGGDTAVALTVPSRVWFIDGYGQAATTFPVGGQVGVRVEDHNLDSPQIREQIQVLVHETGSGDADSVTLIETGYDTNVYEGSIATENGAPASGDGTLQVQAGRVIQAEHSNQGTPQPTVAQATMTSGAVMFVDAEGQPAEVYFERTRAYVRVFDSFADSTSSPDLVTVTLQALITADSESLSLTETGASTGVFEGSILLLPNSADPNNGFLETGQLAGPPVGYDTLTASYQSITGPLTDTAGTIGSRTWFIDAYGNLADSYVAGTTAYVRVENHVANAMPGNYDFVQVTLEAPTTWDFETMYLRETTRESGIFEGAFSLERVDSGALPHSNDGRLQSMPGEEIEVGYADGVPLDKALIRFSSAEFIDEAGEPTGEVLENGVARLRVVTSSQASSIDVSVGSSRAADQVSVTLTETFPGIYEGTVQLSFVPPGGGLGNSLLETSNSGEPDYLGDELTVTYQDGVGRAVTIPSRVRFFDSYGRVTTTFAVGERVGVRVEDHNLDSPQFKEQIQVQVHEVGSGDANSVTLIETGFDTNVYEGSIATEDAPVVGGDGKLQLTPGQVIQAERLNQNTPYPTAAQATMAGASVVFVDAEGRLAETYFERTRAYVRVSDTFADSSPSADSIIATLQTFLGLDSESLMLTETGPSTGVFEGSILLLRGGGSNQNNGYLETDQYAGPPVELDTLTASYSSVSGTVSDTAGMIGSRTWFLDAYGNETDSYTAGTTAFVRVEDHAANAMPDTYDFVQVTLEAPTTGDSETTYLRETTRESGIFEGAFSLERADYPATPSQGDGRLQSTPGEEIGVVYEEYAGDGVSSDKAMIRFSSAEFIDENGEPTGEVLENGVARLRVVSASPGSSVDVSVSSSRTADQVSVTLMETSPGSKVYEGMAQLSFVYPGGGGGVANGRLETSNSGWPDYLGDELTLTFQDGEGHAVTIPSRVWFFDSYGRVVTTFAVGERVGVRVEDHNLDNPTAREQIEVRVRKVGSGGDNDITLIETGFDTNIYEGGIDTEDAPLVSGDGKLQLAPGRVIEADRLNLNTPYPTRAHATMAGASVVFVDAEGRPAEVYYEKTRAYVRVSDTFADSSPSADTITATLQTFLGLDSESVTLTETGPSTGVFEGSIPLSLGDGSGNQSNGFLETAQDSGPPVELDVLTASYQSIAGTVSDTAGMIGSRTWFLDAYGNETDSYTAGTTVFIRVEDHFANPMPGTYDYAQATLTAPATGDSETVYLRETTRDSGIFEGSLSLEREDSPPSPSQNDGRLQSMPGEEIEVVYDEPAGYGRSSDKAVIRYSSAEFIDEAGEPTNEVLENGVARLRVTSASPGSGSSVDVSVTSSRAGDQLSVTLIETSPGSKVYEGMAQLSFVYAGGGGGIANGLLETSNGGYPEYLGDELTLTYQDGEARAVTIPSRVRFLDSYGRVVTTFAVGERVGVRVEDHNLNNPTAREQIEVRVRKVGSGGDNDVTLIETGFDTNIYEGGIDTEDAPEVSGDGKLQVAPGQVIEAERPNQNTPYSTRAQAVMAGASVVFVDAEGRPAEVYYEKTRAYVRVSDTFADSSPSADTITATLQTFLGLDSESVTLTETGPSTGVFEGSIPLSLNTATPSNGFLETVQDSGPPVELDVLTASYQSIAGTVSDTAGMIGSRTWFLDAYGNETDSYTAGTTAFIRVEDHFANPMPGTYDYAQATLTAPATGDSETVYLRETTRDSGIFEGSLSLEREDSPPSPSQNDGRLQSMPGEEIEVVYDEPAGYGRSSDKAVIRYSSAEFIDEAGEPTNEVLENGVARLRVTSASPGSGSSVDVSVTSSRAGDQLSVTLMETSPGSKVYEGMAQLSFVYAGGGGGIANGLLETSNSGYPEYLGDELTLTYQDGEGHAVTIPSRVWFLDSYGRVVTTFAVGERVGVRVEDHNLDNPGAREQIEVRVRKAGSGGDNDVTLIETGFDTNIYEGGIDTEDEPEVSGDGKLQVAPGQVIQAERPNQNTPYSTRAQAVMSGASVVFVDAGGQSAEVYYEGTRAYVRVSDTFADFSPSADQITATVQTFLGLDSESLSLTETGPSTGVFEGSIPLRLDTATPNNGYLETSRDPGPPGELDTLTASYQSVAGTVSDTAGIRGSRTWFIDAYGNETDSYAAGSTAYVRVEDHVAGWIPNQFEYAMVSLSSLSTGDFETLHLFETAPGSSVFEGPVSLEDGGYSPYDGRLQSVPGEEIEVLHSEPAGYSSSSDRAVIRYSSAEFIDETGEPTNQVLENGVARLRVRSSSPGSSVDVSVTSSHAADQLSVTLMETSPGSKVYEGMVQLSFVYAGGGGGIANGLLETSNSGYPEYLGDDLTLTYQDGEGRAVTIPSRVRFFDSYGRVVTTFAVGERVGVRVEDHNLDNPAAREEIEVFVREAGSGDANGVILIETGFDTNIYEGGIDTEDAPVVSGDGKLQVAPGRVIEAERPNQNTPYPTRAQATMAGASVVFIDSEGRLAEAYFENTTAYVRVSDTFADFSPSADQITVTLQSSLGLDTEYQTLTETGPSTGVFEGPVPTSPIPPAPQGSASQGNGVLETSRISIPPLQDTLTASYQSVSGTVSDTAGMIGSRTWFTDSQGNPADGYAAGGTAHIRVEDYTVTGVTTEVRLYSMSTGDVETRIANGADGLFNANVELHRSSIPISGDGKLQSMPGEEIEVRHTEVHGQIASTDRAEIRNAEAIILEDGQAVYGQVLENGVARIRIVDTSPGPQGTVTVRSLYGGDEETVSVAQTTPGIFEGTVQLSFVPEGGGISNNGTLETSNSGTPEYLQDELTVTYLDAEGHAVTVPSRITFHAFAEDSPVTEYAVGSDIRVRVQDQNVNDPAQVDTTSVTLNTAGDSESLTLTETGADTGLFEGLLPSSDTPGAPQDGTLSAGSGTVATAEHLNLHTPHPTTAQLSFNGNFAPQAVDDVAQTVEEQPVTIDVLANDSDPDQDPLAIGWFTQGVNGLVSVDNQMIVYTPEAGFVGTDTFAYIASDSQGGQSQATVTVTVLEGNAPPVAVDDSASTQEDQAVNIAVLVNDSDPDNDPLEVALLTQPASGTATLQTDKTITYTPNPNFTGTDAFTYEIEDPDGETDSATVNVSVTPVNDLPVAVDDSATTDEDTAVTVAVLSNDTDLDNDTLDVVNTTGVTNGSAVVNANETITFTPAEGFHGTVTFDYSMTDGNGGSDVGTVTITINPVNDPPVAHDDTAVTDEDSSVTVNVLDNDTDADDDFLGVTAVTQGANGTVTLDPVTYTPAANFHGTDSFTYTVSDGNGGTDTATVNVTVNEANDTPIANDDTATVAEDSPVTVNVLGNDTDADNDTLNVTAVTQGTNGSVTLSPVTYTPNANFHGTDSFTYTVSDGNGGTDTATVTVTVTSVNDDPVANDDTASVVEDDSVIVNVLGNDSDVDNDTLTVTAVTQGANGAVTLNPVTYTPSPNFFGTDSFTYTIGDSTGGGGGVDTATVTVTIAASNDNLTALDDSATVAEDGSVTVTVLGNDSDPENDVLSVQSVTQGTNGSVVIVGTQVTYTPNPDFHGADSFTYTASDGNGGTDSATVTITVTPVNDAPVAGDDTASVVEDGSVAVTVLGNDADVDDDLLTVTSTQGANGSVVINGDDTVTYTPEADFNGTDSFTYTVSDGEDNDTATVTVTVGAANDAPVAADDSASTTEDNPISVAVLVNDTDPENDTLEVSAVTQGTNGAVQHTRSGTAIYTPAANFHGTDSFTYTASDGNGGTDTAMVTVTISSINDAPVANDDPASVAEDGSVTVAVLANDTDADNDTLTVTAVTQGTHGTVTLNPVTYTPAANYNGPDTFTYTISDGNGGTDTATVNVTVGSANDAPVANDDTATVAEDGSVSIPVLTNDTDLDNDTLTVISVTQPANGTVTMNPVTYTPNANFFGTNSFTYTVSDGNGGNDTATVTVTVTAVNDAPVAVNDSATTLAETAVTVLVRTNDTDIEGNTLTITGITQGAHGTVVNNAGQSVTYTPATAWIGPDTFTYTISDGAGGTATATVNITVQAPPRVSTNIQVLYAFNEGSGTTVNDTSGVGTPLNLTVANAAAVTWLPGALSINSNTLVQSAGTATKVINASKASNEVTVEAWVDPLNLSQTGPAAIATISQTNNKRNVTLGQSGTAYNGQLRTSTTGQDGTQHNATNVATTNLTHVVYTRSSTGAVRIYVNGNLVTSATLTGNLSTWANYNLALGGELSGTRYWRGEMHLVAIYSRALTAAEARQNFLAGAN
jgi:hypothetical protein